MNKIKIKCQKCKSEIEIDYTPEYDSQKPYELVCYQCGWFASKRFNKTEVGDPYCKKCEYYKSTGALYCPECLKKFKVIRRTS